MLYSNIYCKFELIVNHISLKYLCSYSDSFGYKESQNAFLFSFVNRDNIPPFKSDVRLTQYAIATSSYYGPTFGGGHDIHIADNAGSSTGSYTNFGHTYTLPHGYMYGSSNILSLLAGSYHFIPSDIEVFSYHV